LGRRLALPEGWRRDVAAFQANFTALKKRTFRLKKRVKLPMIQMKVKKMDIIIANSSTEYGLYQANRAMEMVSDAEVAQMNENVGFRPKSLELLLNSSLPRVVARNMVEYGIYQINKALKESVAIKLANMQRKAGEKVNLIA